MELRIQIAHEQVFGFKDMHVAVHESKPVFHDPILTLLKLARTPSQVCPQGYSGLAYSAAAGAFAMAESAFAKSSSPNP